MSFSESAIGAMRAADSFYGEKLFLSCSIVLVGIIASVLVLDGILKI